MRIERPCSVRIIVIVIAVPEVSDLLSGFFADIGGFVHGPGVKRYQIIHLVSAVNVHCQTYGAESVRGIDISPVVTVVIHPPVVPIFIPEGFQIVDVGTFTVEQIAENAVLGHVETGEFEES